MSTYIREKCCPSLARRRPQRDKHDGHRRSFRDFAGKRLMQRHDRWRHCCQCCRQSCLPGWRDLDGQNRVDSDGRPKAPGRLPFKHSFVQGDSRKAPAKCQRRRQGARRIAAFAKLGGRNASRKRSLRPSAASRSFADFRSFGKIPAWRPDPNADLDQGRPSARSV